MGATCSKSTNKKSTNSEENQVVESRRTKRGTRRNGSKKAVSVAIQTDLELTQSVDAAPQIEEASAQEVNTDAQNNKTEKLQAEAVLPPLPPLTIIPNDGSFVLPETPAEPTQTVLNPFDPLARHQSNNNSINNSIPIDGSPISSRNSAPVLLTRSTPHSPVVNNAILQATAVHEKFQQLIHQSCTATLTIKLSETQRRNSPEDAERSQSPQLRFISAKLSEFHGETAWLLGDQPESSTSDIDVNALIPERMREVHTRLMRGIFIDQRNTQRNWKDFYNMVNNAVRLINPVTHQEQFGKIEMMYSEENSTSQSLKFTVRFTKLMQIPLGTTASTFFNHRRKGSIAFSSLVNTENMLEQDEMDLERLINNPPPLSDKLLKKIPLLMINSVLELHRGKMSSKGQSLLHRDIQPKNFILKKNHDDITVTLCDDGCYSSVEQKYFSKIPGTPFFFAPELLNCLLDAGMPFPEALAVRTQNYTGKNMQLHSQTGQKTFWHAIKSNIFALGITLQLVIDKIFVASNLQEYKTNLLKLTKLLLCYDPDARMNLSILAECCHHLYSKSENVAAATAEETSQYDKLISMLIKLSDFDYANPKFWKLHALICAELSEALKKRDHIKIHCLHQFVSALHYTQQVLSQLESARFNQVISDLKGQISIINKLNLLCQYGFSAPRDPRFYENLALLSDIIQFYHTKQSENAAEIIAIFDRHKETLCDLPEKELTDLMQQTGMIEEPITMGCRR